MRFFLKNQVIVSRLKVTSGSLRDYQTTGTADASVQPIVENRSQIGPGVFSKRYKVWCPLGTDIKEGDRLVDENGVNYTVREVRESIFGAYNFIEAIVEKSEGPND